MSEHALLSPSSAHRWLVCPGSVAMESSFPNTTNSSADFGTACHELAECVLKAPDGLALKDFIGGKTKSDHIITQPMVDLVQIYMDCLSEYAQGNTVLIEQRVDFSSYINVPNSFGTSDAVIIVTDGTELQVHDLKTGYHLVHAENNPQLKLYGLGALHEFGMLGNFERVRLVIHQPSQNHLDEWDCSVEDLLTFAREARYQAGEALKAIALLKANDDIAPFLNPEEKACQYCRAAATCPALTQKIAQTIEVPFEEWDSSIRITIPEDAEILSRKMKTTDLIENWLKSVRAETERQLLAGTPVPGYKIVRGKQGNRKWMDEDEVIKAFKAIKLPKSQMYHSVLISPTDAEKVLKIAPDKWAKITPFITRSEGSLSVALESDKRHAINILPVHDSFEDLTGSDLI